MSRTETVRDGFTGRHMLLVMVAFFGVVIAVNLTMAFLARSSWTGLVVDNAYIASRAFNDKVAAARELEERGWTARLHIADGRIRYALADAEGRALHPDRVSILFRRPAHAAEDRAVALRPVHGGFEAMHALADGVWIAEVDVEAGGETVWRDVRRIVLHQGTL